MRRVMFFVGFATGYVLGAKAGRERYESITRLAGRVKSSQTAQSAAGVLRAQAGTVADEARRRLPVPGRFGNSHQPEAHQTEV
jgi:hypothetical protein